MTYSAITVFIGTIVLFTNFLAQIWVFGAKRSTRFTMAMFTLFTIAFYACMHFFSTIVPTKEGLVSLVFIFPVILLLKGKLTHNIFFFFVMFVLTFLQINLSEAISSLFAPAYSFKWCAIGFTIQGIVRVTYVIVFYVFGRRMYEKMFMNANRTEWSMYIFGMVFSYVTLVINQVAENRLLATITILLFIIWSFTVLCYAIVNSNEKLQRHYEIELAKDIIKSGRDHYEKMGEMLDTLRILRHDHKYHLDVIRELASSGKTKELDEYVKELENKLDVKTLTHYCSNSVINALITSYAERCQNLGIQFESEIVMPTTISTPNYEMCIVLGNLLENAVYASEQCENNPSIKLIIKTQGNQLVTMVKNSYNSALPAAAAKKDGGLGLRSVNAVAARYDGELMREQDDNYYTAYVLMKL